MALSQEFLEGSSHEQEDKDSICSLPVSAEPKPHVVRGQATESLVLKIWYQEPHKQDDELPGHPAVKQGHFRKDEEHDRRPTSTPQ